MSYQRWKLEMLWVWQRNKPSMWPWAETGNADCNKSCRRRQHRRQDSGCTVQEWVPLHVPHCRSCAGGNAWYPLHQKLSSAHRGDILSPSSSKVPITDNTWRKWLGFAYRRKSGRNKYFPIVVKYFLWHLSIFLSEHQQNEEKNCPEAVSEISSYVFSLMNVVFILIFPAQNKTHCYRKKMC